MRWSVNSAITQNYGPPPPTGWQRSDHSDSHACIIVQPDMYLVSRNVSFRIVSRAKRGISKNASDIFFFLDHLLTHELNCIYIYIYSTRTLPPLLPLQRRTVFTEMRPNWWPPPIIAPPLLNLRGRMLSSYECQV